MKKGGVDLDLGYHVRYFDYGGVYPRALSGLKVSRCSSGCQTTLPHGGPASQLGLLQLPRLSLFPPLQGLGVSRRFLEQCIRDRVFAEGTASGVLEVRDGAKAADFLWRGDDVEGERGYF